LRTAKSSNMLYPGCLADAAQFGTHSSRETPDSPLKSEEECCLHGWSSSNSRIRASDPHLSRRGINTCSLK
jgi:hypothetical protein